MSQSGVEQSVTLALADAELGGTLVMPLGTRAVVAFAHGSGSSRFSPRNRAVAEHLNRAGLGTLLFDLLTPEESRIDACSMRYRFHIALLGERMTGAVDWLRGQSATRDPALGLFGASTGAAAALVAAAARPREVAAVVSRGGRPDLADDALASVRAPTLLIVGERDSDVIVLNRKAAGALRCPRELAIVPGASHLFEEPGKIEQVQELAANWFVRYLTGGRARGE